MTKSELIEKIKNYFSELSGRTSAWVSISDKSDIIGLDGEYDIEELAEFILRSEK